MSLSKILLNLSFQFCTCVSKCFKLGIISPLCSNDNYLNEHQSCIPKFEVREENYNTVNYEEILFKLNKVMVL